MTFQVQSILRSLFEDETLPTPDCPGCQDQLSAFVDAELGGEDAAAAFPAVRSHLAGCPTCRLVREELTALLSLEHAGQLAAPPPPAPFDFGYLPAPATRPAADAPKRDRPWRLDALGRLIIQFSDELLRSLQGPALQPSTLKSASAQAVQVAVAGEIDDLNVHVSAEPTARDPRLIDVEVEVDIPSRGGWPNLAGSVVTLFVEGDAIDRQETDAFGKALFENIPADVLPRLSILIEAEH